MTTAQIAEIYQRIVDGNNVFEEQPLVEAPTIVKYYVIKAHKLVNEGHFMAYWRDGKSKDPLRAVLKHLYSDKTGDALQHCHQASEGLPKLSKYVEIATPILTTKL